MGAFLSLLIQWRKETGNRERDWCLGHSAANVIRIRFLTRDMLWEAMGVHVSVWTPEGYV